jgi:excisionase family DNA binding protein
VNQALTIAQVAESLQLHKDGVYAIIRCGKLRAFKLHGDRGEIRVSAQALADYIKAQESEFSAADSVAVNVAVAHRRTPTHTDAQQLSRRRKSHV